MDGRFATGVALVSAVLLLSPFVPSAIRAFASLLPPAEAEKPWSVACFNPRNIHEFYNVVADCPEEGNLYDVLIESGSPYPYSVWINDIYFSVPPFGYIYRELILDNTKPIRVSFLTSLGRTRDILVPSTYHFISPFYEDFSFIENLSLSLLAGADKDLENAYLWLRMPSFIYIEDNRMVVRKYPAPDIWEEAEVIKRGSTGEARIDDIVGGHAVCSSAKIDISFNVPDVKTPFSLRFATYSENVDCAVEVYTPSGVHLQETKKFDQYSWVYAETSAIFVSTIINKQGWEYFDAVLIPATTVMAVASIYPPPTFMPPPTLPPTFMPKIAPMYLGAGPKVSAFGYYFTSENGCVLLVRAVCENGDPLPAGTKVRMDSEYLSQTEYDVWYKIYPAGTPSPSTVFVTFEVPGYINISQAVPVSERGLLGDLQVFTVDEKGNPIPALVEVRMNGVLVGSQQSTGVAAFRGLSAGKATVSAVVSPSGKEGFSCLLSPPPAEVDVAPNKMSTATLVFKRVYDTSVTGKVSVTNTGSYPLVITIDGAVTYTVFPGETSYLELPAGDHYAMYTGTEPLLYDPQVMSFTLGKDEEEHLRLRVSPARDENWVSEWMENARKGVGVGDLAVIVCDMVSGTPIPGASVYLDVGLQQTTNSSGLCYFRGVPTGDRKVKACTQGYFPATATARVEEGAVASVRVCLRGFLYEAKPAPPTGRYLILGFLAILLPGVVMIWQYRRR
jgi:hypothetical protein